tara:strand:+ start:171 stop:644 length:474 start_codon:yes stop_codon:yes gene_type:complete
MPTIKVLTSDNNSINMDSTHVECLKLIHTLINEYNDDDDDICLHDDDIIELPLDVDIYTMNKILEVVYYEFHNKNKNMTEQDYYNWYNDYFTDNYDTLHTILDKADYLEYDKLVDLGCERIANDIKSCKGIEEVKQKLDLKREITREEENELLNLYK